MRLALLLSLLLTGCQFIYEPTPEPRYRWVSHRDWGGHWEKHPAGKYVWAGKEYHHVASVTEDVGAMSKRWR